MNGYDFFFRQVDLFCHPLVAEVQVVIKMWLFSGEKPYLSKQGQEIKKMVNGDRKRVAHTPKFESTEFSKQRDSCKSTRN
jgi:hypothetical protein